MDKKRLQKLAGIKPVNEALVDPLAKNILKNLKKNAESQAKRGMKNAIGLRNAWLDAEAKARIFEEMIVTLDQAATGSEEEILQFFQEHFDVDAGEYGELDKIGKINSLVLLKDLLGDSKETLVDNVRDMGFDAIVDIEPAFLKAILKVKI